MKRRLPWLLLGLIIGLLTSHSLNAFFFPSAVQTVFSPDNGNEILNLIDESQKSLDIEMYLFTSQDVVQSLEKAKLRGVTVRVILEKDVIGNDNTDIFRQLATKGFSVRYASKIYSLTHAKFMIIDGQMVLIGSHNFSNAALKKNREASVIIFDQNAISEFQEVFDKDWVLASGNQKSN